MFKLHSSAAPAQAHSKSALAESADKFGALLRQSTTIAGLTNRHQDLAIRSAAAGALPKMTEPVVEAGDFERMEPEPDTRHRAKMAEIHEQKRRQVLKLAADGSFGDALPLEAVVALACTGLTGTADKQTCKCWTDSLQVLLAAGQLNAGESGEIYRSEVIRVMPLLKAEGLKPGTALTMWMDAESQQVPKRAADAVAVVASSPVEKPSQAGVHKKDCPEWLSAKLRQIQFLDRVKEGAAAVKVVLVPGKDFSASAVVQALEKLGVIPECTNRKTMQAAVREFYDDYEWKSRDPGEEMAATLVEHYKRGEAIAKQADDAVASKARATMRGV